MENNNNTSNEKDIRKTQPEYTPSNGYEYGDDDIPPIDNIAPTEDDRPRRDGPGGA